MTVQPVTRGIAKVRTGYYALEDVHLAQLQLESSRMALRRCVQAARRVGWSWNDIAEVLGISAATAADRFKRQGVH